MKQVTVSKNALDTLCDLVIDLIRENQSLKQDERSQPVPKVGCPNG